jgi:hypothetical protein
MAPTPLPLVMVTALPEFPVPVEPPVGVALLELPPPPLAEELLLDEDEAPPELLELPPLEPPLLLELLLDEPPPPPLELELLLLDEPPPPPLELLELLEPLEPPPAELLELEPPLPPPGPVSLLAAGRQPVPIASSPAKHRLAKPVPASRRKRPKVTFFVMMPSLVPGGSRLNLTKCESGVLELTRWSGGI